MKNLVLIFIFSNLILACRNSAVPGKPEILTAKYEIVTSGEFERGYNIWVDFKLDNYQAIKYIILNHKRFDVKEITLNSHGYYIIEGYFPVESKMIQNFNPPKPDNRPDGIIFDVNGKAYFYEIKFKLIN